MPRIPDAIVTGAAFLFRTRAEAKARARIGGSAFLITKPIEGSEQFAGKLLRVPYLISNRHVVYSGCASVVSVNRRDGKENDIFEYEPTDWTVHPKGDDIAAICVFGDFMNLVHEMSHVGSEQLLTADGLKTMQIGVGDEVFMIGRFINHQGKTRNRPAARFGSISMMEEDIWVSADTRYQLSIAVEMRSRTGFSGSPVAVYRTGQPLSKVNYTDFWGLLGINWGHILDENGENTWLNGVVPAWKILELLETPELKKKHQDVTDITRERAKKPGATSEQGIAGVPPPSDENPNHLADFRTLVDAATRKRTQGE